MGGLSYQLHGLNFLVWVYTHTKLVYVMGIHKTLLFCAHKTKTLSYWGKVTNVQLYIYYILCKVHSKHQILNHITVCCRIRISIDESVIYLRFRIWIAFNLTLDLQTDLYYFPSCVTYYYIFQITSYYSCIIMESSSIKYWIIKWSLHNFTDSGSVLMDPYNYMSMISDPNCTHIDTVNVQ